MKMKMKMIMKMKMKMKMNVIDSNDITFYYDGEGAQPTTVAILIDISI